MKRFDSGSFDENHVEILKETFKKVNKYKISRKRNNYKY